MVDLGAWWHEKTGLPLPLGGNCIRKDLGRDVMQEVTDILKRSIQYSLDHRAEAVEYALQFGRDLDRKLADQFVGMYVNHWTLDYGPRGREAITRLLEGRRRGRTGAGRWRRSSTSRRGEASQRWRERLGFRPTLRASAGGGAEVVAARRAAAAARRRRRRRSVTAHATGGSINRPLRNQCGADTLYSEPLGPRRPPYWKPAALKPGNSLPQSRPCWRQSVTRPRAEITHHSGSWREKLSTSPPARLGGKR